MCWAAHSIEKKVHMLWKPMALVSDPSSFANNLRNHGESRAKWPLTHGEVLVTAQPTATTQNTYQYQQQGSC